LLRCQRCDHDHSRDEQHGESAREGGFRVSRPREAKADVEEKQRHEQSDDEVRTRSGDGAPVEEGREQEVGVAGPEPDVEVRQPRDRRIVLGVGDQVQVIEAEVVVVGRPERLVGEDRPARRHRDEGAAGAPVESRP
jgi:hypothetical protein